MSGRNARLVLAGTGVLISAYLALFQWGILASVWDPLFGNGSARVLHSAISRWLMAHLGLPDAALGAGTYLLETLLLATSGLRPSFLPWANRLAAMLVAVSLGLVALQAFVIHAWCALCLSSAAISIAVFLLGREL